MYRPRPLTFGLLHLTAAATLAFTIGCAVRSGAHAQGPAETQISPTQSPSPAQNPSGPNVGASQQLKDNLPMIAKGHSDKLQLAFYVRTFRTVDPQVKAFVDRMHDQQKEQEKRLKDWAHKNHFDLKYRYTDDAPGHAQKAMEKEQGDNLQAQKGPDFEREVLILMYTDYDWQRHLSAALIPYSPDPELRNYLIDNAKMHEAGVAEIRELLHHFKPDFAPAR